LLQIDRRDAQAPSDPLQFVLVIKNKQDSFAYNTVKRVCDIGLGVASQCVLSSKIAVQTGNKMDQYLSNVLLKINAKMGGKNTVVLPYAARTGIANPSFTSKFHIVLGADVTHPSPGPDSSCSVAALVGSTDLHGCQYTGALRNQAARQEIITDMGGMFLEGEGCSR
jgi:eukaryotic translation initiation factor 2C